MEAEATMDKENNRLEKKKKGLIGRFRRSRKGRAAGADKRSPSSSPQNAPSPPPREEEDIPVAEDNTKSTKDREAAAQRKSRLPVRDRCTMENAPTARESAFSGPPRYDWIDIETAAAIKVQAAYRRNKVMRDLERQGLSTAAIRNRARRQKALKQPRGIIGGEDIPNIFACCGVGLAFGDATAEDYEVIREKEKLEYENRKKEREAREAELRSNYMKQSVAKKKGKDDVEEVVEMVY